MVGHRKSILVIASVTVIFTRTEKLQELAKTRYNQLIVYALLSVVANNAKYDTISFVKYGDKPSVAVTSRIVRAVCRPPYLLVF